MTTALLRIALTLPAAFVAVPHRRVATAPAASRCAPAVAKEAPLPRDIKEVINQMRASVQTGLQARLSRMDVDLPYGAEFGVEGGEKRKKGAMLTSEDVARSDRELARLFVEMFDGTGLRPLVLFSDEKQAKRAKELWPGVEARVAALGGKASAPSSAAKPRKAAKKRSGGGGGGFGAPAAKPGGAPAPPRSLTEVPETTEVLFAVRPGPAQLAAIQAFCEDFGMDRLVILMNARVDTLESAWWRDTFEQVYTFITDPLGAAQKGGGAAADPPAVVWRAYPDEWVVATKPKIGPPKEVASLSERPSAAVIEAALAEAKAGGGGLLEGLGLGNVF